MYTVQYSPQLCGWGDRDWVSMSGALDSNRQNSSMPKIQWQHIYADLTIPHLWENWDIAIKYHETFWFFFEKHWETRWHFDMKINFWIIFVSTNNKSIFLFFVKCTLNTNKLFSGLGKTFFIILQKTGDFALCIWVSSVISFYTTGKKYLQK